MSKTSPEKRRRTRLAAIGAVAGTLCAVMVVLHVPSLRMRVLGASGGGCPWDKAPSQQEREDHRKQIAKTMRTDRRATARPAFGFELDRTTKDAVLAWGKAENRTCTDELAGAAVRCEAPDAAKGVVKDAFFRFDPQGRLVGIDLMREGTDPDAAVVLVTQLETDVTKAAGEPSSKRGALSGAHLGAGYLSQTAFEYRFTDYAADISATNLGGQGIVVREQYRSLSNGS